MSASLARLEICLSSKWVGLLCGLVFLVSAHVAAAAQQPKPGEAQKAPAVSQAKKKPKVMVFTLSGTPAPGKQWERPRGVPKVQPLSIGEKLTIAQGVHGIPTLSAAAGTPFLTLYPGHLYDPLGSLELGWPEWDRLGIAYYSQAIATGYEDARDSLAKEEHAELTFKADAGNVYLVDFIVVIEVPTTSTGERDFELKVSGLAPSEVKAFSGGNHLTAVFYVQTGGYYTARLGLKPKQNGGTYPRWGDWYFLATDVTKFVPAQ